MNQLPPIPDIFGNYTIRGIEEVLPPAAISLFPAAPGWRYLALLLLALTLWWSWKRLQRWQRNRYRQTALAALDELLNQHSLQPTLLPPLAALIKATALQVSSREDIAALSGQSWLDWLNAQSPEPLFGNSSRVLLTEALYRGRIGIGSDALQQLVTETRQWIQQHNEAADA